MGVDRQEDEQLIPSEKIKDFGAHHHKYYSLEVSFFSNSLDAPILQELWQKYWGVRLAQSALWENEVGEGMDYRVELLRERDQGPAVEVLRARG